MKYIRRNISGEFIIILLRWIIKKFRCNNIFLIIFLTLRELIVIISKKKKKGNENGGIIYRNVK